MEEIQSTYYGAYYEPLKELEQEVLGWLSELVDGLSDRQGERSVEHIRSRIKSADGMREKLARKDLPQDAETAVGAISDIIGFRLVTHFVGDVYELVFCGKGKGLYCQSETQWVPQLPCDHRMSISAGSKGDDPCGDTASDHCHGLLGKPGA